MSDATPTQEIDHLLLAVAGVVPQVAPCRLRLACISHQYRKGNYDRSGHNSHLASTKIQTCVLAHNFYAELFLFYSFYFRSRTLACIQGTGVSVLTGKQRLF